MGRVFGGKKQIRPTTEQEEIYMKTYYCVTSSFDDRGRVTAGITSTIEAEIMPESTYTSTRRKDIYNDWFEDVEEAKKFVEEAKAA